MFFPFNFIVKKGKGSAGTAWGQRGHYNNPTVWQYPTETQIQSNCSFPGIYSNLCMSGWYEYI